MENRTNGFKIIGISTRTTNKDNASQEDMGKLWGRFFAENIFEKIPNKTSSEIIVVYTDYKSDYTDEYSVIIGGRVSSLEHIPEGLVGREFHPEKFQKFLAKGEMPNAVIHTWIQIWQAEDELNRSYTYDFEVYGENSQNGKDSEVDIYISVNNS